MVWSTGKSSRMVPSPFPLPTRFRDDSGLRQLGRRSRWRLRGIAGEGSRWTCGASSGEHYIDN